MISLLTIIDNPDNDIPLAAVLRSPIVGLTEPELGQIRVAEKQGSFYQALLAYGQVGEAQLQEKVTAFLAQLTTWRDLSKVRSIPGHGCGTATLCQFDRFGGSGPNL